MALGLCSTMTSQIDSVYRPHCAINKESLKNTGCILALYFFIAFGLLSTCARMNTHVRTSAMRRLVSVYAIPVKRVCSARNYGRTPKSRALPLRQVFGSGISVCVTAVSSQNRTRRMRLVLLRLLHTE
jgi:hypothetical protein